MINMSCDNRIDSNTGFTLVELIVCVTILAVASAVLIKSFSLSAMTNAKAQRMQSATNLAESVMEEVKSSSVKQLQKKYNGSETTTIPITAPDDTYESISAAALTQISSGSKFLTGGTVQTPYYVLVKRGVTSAKSTGELFDVTATMRTKPYSGGAADDASDANSFKLPVIEEIDTHTKTVLSAKELNKYDVAAADYFREHTVTEGTLTLKSKKISIEKSGDGSASSTDGIRVKCTVLYTASDDTTKYSKEVFNGTYVPQKDKTGTVQPVNNDIYIFYNRFLSANEDITVSDTSTNADGHHRVYVIFQKDMNETFEDTSDDSDMDNIAGTSISITGTGGASISASTSNSSIYYDDAGVRTYGRARSGDYWLITNLPQTPGSVGTMLEKKEKNRVFEVTVRVNKSNSSETYATITSTVDVRE